jgi:hypothetical protein
MRRPILHITKRHREHFFYLFLPSRPLTLFWLLIGVQKVVPYYPFLQPPPPRTSGPEDARGGANVTEVQSVRSGSEFWADGRSRTPSSRAFTGRGSHCLSDVGDESEKGRKSYTMRILSHAHQGRGTNESQYTTEDDDNDSQGT